MREGGDGLTGGANLAERGKQAWLREERRRHVGPAGQTYSGDSGDACERRKAADGGPRSAAAEASARREVAAGPV